MGPRAGRDAARGGAARRDRLGLWALGLVTSPWVAAPHVFALAVVASAAGAALPNPVGGERLDNAIVAATVDALVYLCAP